MKFRVIAGQYGGRNIDAPNNRLTHPMSERVRNAIFNSIGSEIVDTNILDAFAGSGSIGIEALSRGAAEATFVEKDRIAGKVIAENLALLKAQSKSRLIKSPLSSWIDSRDAADGYDIIFADPPYNQEQFSTVAKLFDLLKPGALMVLSHSGRGEVPIQKHGIVVVDNRSYGNAYLTFFRRET